MKKRILVAASLLAVCLTTSCGRGSEKLTVYLAEEDAFYRNTLAAFQQDCPEVALEIRSFETYEQMHSQLDPELMSDKGPDVLLLNSRKDGSDGWKLAQSGILLPLDGLREELTDGDYPDVLLNAGVIDGEQLLLPLSYNLPQVYAAASLLEEREDLPLYELLTAESALLQGDDSRAAMSVQLGRSDALNFFTEVMGISLIDRDGKPASAPGDFQEAAAFTAVIYGDLNKIGAISSRYRNDFAGAASHFSFLLENYSFLNNLRYYQSVYPQLLGEEMMVLFPGQPEHPDSLTAQIVHYGGIRAGTGHEEEAVRLLRYLLDAKTDMNFSKYEENNACYAPVSRSAYEAAVDALTRTKGIGPCAIEPLSEQNAALLLDLPERLTGAVIPSPGVGEILQKTMEPYLTGKANFDSCWQELLGQLTLYLSE